ARDRSLVLDGEVGDAAPRVEPVGRGESVGRADVEAGMAGPAMVHLRLVGIELRGGEDRAEEEPGTEFAADEARMLALPAEAGGCGKRLLHVRTGNDGVFSFDSAVPRQFAGDWFELDFDLVMIVAILRIDRDRATILAGKDFQRIAVG